MPWLVGLELEPALLQLGEQLMFYPLRKRGQGGFKNGSNPKQVQIPLNPPLPKGEVRKSNKEERCNFDKIYPKVATALICPP